MSIDEIIKDFIKDFIMTGETIYWHVAIEFKQNEEDASNPVRVGVTHADGDKIEITITVKSGD